MNVFKWPCVCYLLPTFIAVGLLLFLVVRFLKRIGILKCVKIEEVDTEESYFVYRSFKQNYRQSGVGLMEIEEEVKKYGIPSRRSFGIYYDNPREVKAEECRSILGVILESTEDFEKFPDDCDLSFNKLKADKRIVVEWPMYYFLGIMVGIFRVYPKLIKELEKRELMGPLMELYDEQEHKMWFLGPVDTGHKYFDETEASAGDETKEE